MTVDRTPLTRISGIDTFMRAHQGDVEDLRDGMVAIAGVSYDLSCTSRIGARHAPRAIREASRYYAGQLDRGEMVEITTGQRMKAPSGVKVIDVGDLNVYPVEWDKTQHSLRDSMFQLSRTGALPIILGGDHFITYPLVEGFRDAVLSRGGAKIGYIQFSSQLDLGDEDPVWGRVWRGATARRILDSGAVDPKHMVWIGANGYIRYEQWDLAKKLNLNVFTLDDVRGQGITNIARRAADLAGSDCDAIYLSIDFDVIDGGYVAATGSPSFDGLTNVELLKAIDVLGRSKVGTMDLVGLNPNIEMLAATGQRLAAWIIIRLISHEFMQWD